MAKSPDTIARKTGKRTGDGIAIPPGPAPKGGRKTAAKSADRSAKAKPVAAGPAGGKTPKRSGAAPLRRPPRKTFLVAVTVQDGDAADLRVYAAVTRMPAQALDAVRDALGPNVTVELTGKLSGRMAKALKLKAGEVRRI